MAQFEVARGEGRTEQEIFIQEIANVQSNRFMTNREKELKINQLKTIINAAKNNPTKCTKSDSSPKA